ncbi:solute carrier family 25 member 43 isoform X2 [Scyliorhinus torazame]|uniref:solute carrier family 25 member 43 isoform X2 n=1 Tax=Scyliorhinus torazame TaxID=75743 RepID=UPI003B59513D
MVLGKRDSRITSCQSLGCGAVAGLLSRSFTCPLDVVKVLSQVGTFHSKRGFLSTFWMLAQAEGVRALWKGNWIACMRLFPHSTVQLAAYNKFVSLSMDDFGHISHWSAIVAGSLAGILAAILTYPAELIETRLIVQNSAAPTYRGIVHTFFTVYTKEGFLALYRGASLTVMGTVPFSAGSFLVYINLDRLWNKPSVKHTPLQNFGNGCLAAGVAQTVSFPFETVKRKMQIIPYYGLMFSTLEFCKRVCLYNNGYIVSPLSYRPRPGVDQSLGAEELQELRRLIRGKSFENNQSALGTKWWG